LLEMSQDGEDEDGEVATDTHAPRAHALACARTHPRWRVHTQTWAELAKQIVIGDMKVPIALSELPIYTQMCVLRIDSPGVAPGLAAHRKHRHTPHRAGTRGSGAGTRARTTSTPSCGRRCRSAGSSKTRCPRSAPARMWRSGECISHIPAGASPVPARMWAGGRAQSRRGCGQGGEPSPGAGRGDLL
jgi:hypothetical protein